MCVSHVTNCYYIMKDWKWNAKLLKRRKKTGKREKNSGFIIIEIDINVFVWNIKENKEDMLFLFKRNLQDYRIFFFL